MSHWLVSLMRSTANRPRTAFRNYYSEILLGFVYVSILHCVTSHLILLSLIKNTCRRIKSQYTWCPINYLLSKPILLYLHCFIIWDDSLVKYFLKINHPLSVVKKNAIPSKVFTDLVEQSELNIYGQVFNSIIFL